MKRIFFILITLLLLPAGCKDDNDEDMQKYLQPFLGQWREIGRGNDTYPELTPDGHVIGFLPDGIAHGLFGSGIINGTMTCRADAEYLYFGSGTVPDGYTWRYTFTGADTLRLDYVAGAMTKSMSTPHFHIYERTLLMFIND